jgi:SAM-dependent methyltransferase
VTLHATQGMGSLLAGLRAAGEETRLRILALLTEGELSVSDLTDILGQSQPRISRHLKLMAEAGLVRRHREGAFAFFRLAEGAGGGLAQWLALRVDMADPVTAADRNRLVAVREARAHAAQGYFARMAADWDQLRNLHASDDAVEAAVLGAVGDAPLGSVLDLGTGTGRILALLSPRASRAVGLDASHAMLQVARANLERVKTSIAGGRVDLRQGDIHALPFERGSFDVVIVHQVLHFLDDPARALKEAAAVLAPGGKLIIVDFAPHELEFLRADHAHRRLGFAPGQVADWLSESGLDCDLTTRIAAQSAAGDTALTVMLWRGQDRRIAGDVPLRQDYNTTTQREVA